MSGRSEGETEEDEKLPLKSDVASIVVVALDESWTRSGKFPLFALCSSLRKFVEFFNNKYTTQKKGFEMSTANEGSNKDVVNDVQLNSIKVFISPSSLAVLRVFVQIKYEFIWMRSQPFTMCAHFQGISDRATQKLRRLNQNCAIIHRHLGVWEKSNDHFTCQSKDSEKKRARSTQPEHSCASVRAHGDESGGGEENYFRSVKRTLFLRLVERSLYLHSTRTYTMNSSSLALWRNDLSPRGGGEEKSFRPRMISCGAHHVSVNVREIREKYPRDFLFLNTLRPSSSSRQNIGNLVSRLSRVFDVFFSVFLPPRCRQYVQGAADSQPEKNFDFSLQQFRIFLINTAHNAGDDRQLLCCWARQDQGGGGRAKTREKRSEAINEQQREKWGLEIEEFVSSSNGDEGKINDFSVPVVCELENWNIIGIIPLQTRNLMPSCGKCNADEGEWKNCFVEFPFLSPWKTKLWWFSASRVSICIRSTLNERVLCVWFDLYGTKKKGNKEERERPDNDQNKFQLFPLWKSDNRTKTGFEALK